MKLLHHHLKTYNSPSDENAQQKTIEHLQKELKCAHKAAIDSTTNRGFFLLSVFKDESLMKLFYEGSRSEGADEDEEYESEEHDPAAIPLLFPSTVYLNLVTVFYMLADEVE